MKADGSIWVPMAPCKKKDNSNNSIRINRKGLKRMKAEIKVMEAMMENRKTKEQAPACTILVNGELKTVLDQLMKENPQLQSYGQAVATVMEFGIQALEGKDSDCCTK